MESWMNPVQMLIYAVSWVLVQIVTFWWLLVLGCFIWLLYALRRDLRRRDGKAGP